MRAANSERSLRLQLARSQYCGQCGGRNKRRKMLQSRHAQDIARGSSSKFDGVGNTTYCALAGRRSRPEPRWVRRLPRSVMQTNASGTRAAREWATRPTDARKRCAGQCNASVMLENATRNANVLPHGHMGSRRDARLMYGAIWTHVMPENATATRARVVLTTPPPRRHWYWRRGWYTGCSAQAADCGLARAVIKRLRAY
jgi:hypothetical protein